MSVGKGLCSGPDIPCGSFRRLWPSAAPQTPPSPCRDETDPLPTSYPFSAHRRPQRSAAMLGEMDTLCTSKRAALGQL
eukprot:scaffold17511_cov15-Prasinocladus_malaysianus.AAC.1